MSKTDHPRIPGSHRALTKAHRLDLDWPGERRKPALLAVTEIHEALREEPAVLALPARKVECRYCGIHPEPMAHWERNLLDLGFDDPDPDVELDADGKWTCFECRDNLTQGLDSFTSEAKIARLRDLLMSTDEGDAEQYVDDYVPFEEDDDYDDDGDYYEDTAWLPLMTIEQAREAFGGRDFIIQHSNVLRRTR